MQKIKTKENIWVSPNQLYDFFSIFLDRRVLNISHLDLSFTPTDYLELLLNSSETEEGRGYIHLLIMLFTEYYQEKLTGLHKISLPTETYKVITKQFLLYCKCELLRRQNNIGLLYEEYLFDPNIKTTFIVDSLNGLHSLKHPLKNARITIRENHPTSA